MLSEAKAWLLGNLAMILGVALVVTGLYAAWLHFHTVPNLELRAQYAEAAVKIQEANFNTCTVSNSGLSGAVDRQTQSIKDLVKSGIENATNIKGLLEKQGATISKTADQLKTFKPNPAKSDCENALDELKSFKEDRK